MKSEKSRILPKKRHRGSLTCPGPAAESVPGARAHWEHWAGAAVGLMGLFTPPHSTHRLPLLLPVHKTYCGVLILV